MEGQPLQGGALSTSTLIRGGRSALYRQRTYTDLCAGLPHLMSTGMVKAS